MRKNRAFLILILIVFYTAVGHSLAHAASECKSFYYSSNPFLKAVAERLNLPSEEMLQVSWGLNELSIVLKDEHRGYMSVGVLFYSAESSGKIIHISSIGADFKKIGVATALFAILLRRFPKTEEIYTDFLGETNREEVEKGIASGLSIEESIKQTPTYKIRALMGFSEIIPQSINKFYGYAVRRESR